MAADKRIPDLPLKAALTNDMLVAVYDPAADITYKMASSVFHANTAALKKYIDDRIAELDTVPEPPTGVFWEINPVVQLSGISNQIVDVSYGKLNRAGVIVEYPAAQFTATLPTSPNLRQDAVEALITGVYNLKTGVESVTVKRPQLTADALWVADVLFTSGGGVKQSTGKVSSVTVQRDGVKGIKQTGDTLVDLGSVVPQLLTDAATVTLNGSISPNGTLIDPALLQTLAFSGTRPGYDYRVAITNANGKTVQLGVMSGVTYKGMNGGVLTELLLPFSDCTVVMYQESASVRRVAVIDGVVAETTGAANPVGRYLKADITVAVDAATNVLTTGAGILVVNGIEHAFTANNFGALTLPAAGFFRVITVFAAYNTTYGATIQTTGQTTDHRHIVRPSMHPTMLWVRDVILTNTGAIVGDAKYLTQYDADLRYPLKSDIDFSTYTGLTTAEADTDVLAVQRADKTMRKWTLARLKTYLYNALGFVKTVNGMSPSVSGDVTVPGQAPTWNYYTADGTQTAFTISGTNVAMVTFDGRAQRNTTDYSISGNTLTTVGTLPSGTVVGVQNMVTVEPNQLAIEFYFDGSATDVYTRTITSQTAGSFVATSSTNVATKAFKKNGVAATLPFTLAAADTLEVTITRTTVKTTSILTLTT